MVDMDIKAPYSSVAKAEGCSRLYSAFMHWTEWTLSQWLCHDDSTIDIVVSISSTINPNIPTNSIEQMHCIYSKYSLNTL